MAKNNSTQAPCPVCNADGSGGGQIQLRSGRVVTCPICKGVGAVDNGSGFPVPQWYQFFFTLTTTATPGPPPVVTSVPQGNPQFLSQDGNFELLELLEDCPAAQFVQALMEDLSGQNKFSQNPISLRNFAGTAQLPFALPAPYVFGPRTQVKITVNNNPPPAATQEVGIGDAVKYVAASPLTGILAANGSVGNILPGSVQIAVSGGGVVVTDDGLGGLTNAGHTAAGTINYVTGAFTLTYVAAPAANAIITATFAQGLAVQNIEIDLFGYLRVPQAGKGSQAPAAKAS